MVLLLVNIGNTNTTVAGFSGGRVVRRVRTPTVECRGKIPDAMIRKALGRGAPEGAILGSTVPGRVDGWRRALKRSGCPDPILIVSPEFDPGFRMSYPGRATLGADRLAGICGGVVRYGAPLIVADFGTAATFNVVTRDRGFIGGVIAAGPDLCLRALASGTAQLPRTPPGRAARVVGRTTEEAMRIGAVTGFAALAGGLVADLRRVAGGARVPVVLTGGGAAHVARRVAPPVRRDDDLVLFGLARLYQLNRDRAAADGQGRDTKRLPRIVNRKSRRAQAPA